MSKSNLKSRKRAAAKYVLQSVAHHVPERGKVTTAEAYQDNLAHRLRRIMDDLAEWQGKVQDAMLDDDETKARERAMRRNS